MAALSAFVASEFIQSCINIVDRHIQSSAVQQKIPKILSAELSALIAGSFNAMIFNEPIKVRIIEQTMSDVPCLDKDPLMPREISREAVQKQNPSTLHIHLSSLGLKHKHTFNANKNSLTLSSRPHSLALTERKSPKQSKSRLDKSKNSLDKDLAALRQESEVEDPEINKLRKFTEARLQGENQYKKLQLKHQKSFQAKLEQLKTLGLEDPQATVTQDYDGQNIKSMIIDDKIQYYSARPGLGATSRRMQNNTLSDIPPEPIKIQKKLMYRQKSISKEIKAMQHPQFPQPQLAPLRMEGFRQYKLNQYKKHFGKGYSRFQQLSKTIEYTSAIDPSDGIFQQKRHLNDSQDLSTIGRSSQLKNSRMSRKLALPKLHGKYKVLDRYSQFDL